MRKILRNFMQNAKAKAVYTSQSRTCRKKQQQQQQHQQLVALNGARFPLAFPSHSPAHPLLLLLQPGILPGILFPPPTVHRT